MVDVIEKIDKLRVERGWSIYKFSKETGTSQQAYHFWMKKKVVPTLSTLNTISEALGLTISEFLSENEIIELTGDKKQLLSYWQKLTAEERKIFLNLLNSFVKKGL